MAPWSSAKEVGDAQKAVDPLGTLYHETGHFYDHKLGLSENQDIANAYKLDKERLEQRLAADGELTEVQKAMIREATSKLSEAIANGIAHGMTNIGED